MGLRNFLLASAATLATGGLSAVAHAEDAAAPAASTPPSTATDDIIVTARRREERLQGVPVSAVAFSQKTLTEKAIATPYDLAKNVPGLIVDAGSGNPGVQQFSIRGRGLNYGAAAGSVETYFAEVPLSAPFGMPQLPPQFFDLSSFTVLKGPQGTLFGRSTTGGAVLIAPQAPTDQFGGYVRLQGGTYGDFQAEGAINIPLVQDKVLLRIAGFDWQRNGYMHTTGGTNEVTGAPLPAQSYANEDVKELRATLLLRPAEGIENTTIVTYHWDDNLASGGPGLNLLGMGTPNGLGAFETPGYGTRLATYGFSLEHPGSKVFALIDTTTLKVSPDLTLKNIFGFIHASGYTNDANTGTALNFPPVSIDTLSPPRPRRNTQYTDELQLQGKAMDGRLSWIIGGLADITREPGALDQLNYGNVDFLFGGLVSILERNQQNSYGLFGSATFKIDDKLNFTAGYRRSFDQVTLDTTGQLPGLVLIPTSAQLQSFKGSDQGNSANAQLEYHANSQVMVYGGWRLGFKRGGFNATSIPGFASFLPEKVNDFFVGVKSEFNVGTMPVRFNVEGYYDLYKDLQVSYYDFINGGVLTVTANVPKTTYRGFEVELEARPSDWLTLQGNYAYLDAFNTSWPDNTVAGETGNLAINPVAYALKNKLTFTTRFHTELPGGQGELVFAPTVDYQSRYYTTPTAVRVTNSTAVGIGPFNMAALGGGIVDGYGLVDLRMEWNHVLGSRFDVAANINNLTNKVYYVGNSATLDFGAEANAYGTPRMFTFEVSTKF